MQLFNLFSATRMKNNLFFVLALPVLISIALIAALNLATAQQAADGVQPEEQTAIAPATNKKSASGKNWIITVANPHAAEAGAAVLRAGGNAIDAMVAVQLTLGLVEPQSSGLGGGGFLLYWNNKTQKLHSVDGRETAPQNVDPKHFLDANGKALKFFDAVVSGRSVGVPGLPKLLHQTHQKFGQKNWEDLFHHPLKLAEEGFKVSPRMAGLIERRAKSLSRFDSTRAYFMDKDGKPLRRGTLLKNSAYAQSLLDFKKEGADAFYKGRIARQIVNAVQTAKDSAGTLTLGDMQNYKAKERQPICSPYKGYSICGMGPPSSGAIAIGQILGVLEPFDLKALGPNNPTAWQLIGDATRLAFADRGRYVADDDFVVVPKKGLLDAAYLAKRAKTLEAGNRLKQANPGNQHSTTR